MADIQPFINIGPGESLKYDLEALGWTQEDFAQITGLSLKTVNEILNDKTALTVETARLIARALGTSAEMWLNMDAAYRVRLLEESEREKDAELYASVMKIMPVREMVKKGWIDPPDSASGLLKEAQDFWEVKEPDFSFLEKKAVPCFRRSQGRESYERFYAMTWAHKAERAAKRIKLPPFDEEAAKMIGNELPDLSRAEDGVVRALDGLKRAGVGFLMLSHLQKTYLDGAALFIRANPFIVYTGRYDRNDHFWFTLAHELAHIVLGHVEKEGDQILDDELKDESESNIEKAADMQASLFLRYEAVIEFCLPFSKYLSRERVGRCADALGLHPGLVVGALQHAGIVPYKNLNSEKVAIKESIPEACIAG